MTSEAINGRENSSSPGELLPHQCIASEVRASNNKKMEGRGRGTCTFIYPPRLLLAGFKIPAGINHGGVGYTYRNTNN